MACKTKTPTKLTTDHKKVLGALKKESEPVNGKAIAAATGLDSKDVTKYIKTLKLEGLVDSPVRCKYAITPEGKKKS